MRQIFVRSLSLAAFLVALPQLATALTPAASATATPDAAARARGVPVEAVPDWVIVRLVPEATPARIAAAGDGQAYLLNDFQVRARADGHDDWFRATVRAVDRSGLEAAGQITTTFNPEFETVALAFAHVIRDGKVLDRTAETRFRIVAEESDLNDGIVGGTLKAMANVPDVRVGDVVDFALVTHDTTRLWPGQVFQWYGERFSDPVAQQSLRYVWPQDLEPRFKLLNSKIAFTRRSGNGTVEWEWTTIDPPAQHGEDNVPNEAFQWGAVDISSMKSWGELSQWATRLYEGDESFPADFTAKIDAIAKASPAPADRLTAAVRLVQDTIRYVGEELGEGSYVPRRPRTVIERGYGDCKDKALLLALALRRLGIDAAPALVSTTNGRSLPDRLPSPLAFDHVIVRAVVDGKVTWIDATGTHRGGRGLSIVPADFAWALPVRPGQAVLERMEGADALAGKSRVVERFIVDEAAATPLRLHVESTYTAASADAMRAHVADTGATDVGRENTDFYRKRFAGLAETTPVSFIDDRDANVLTMVEDYSLSRDDFVKDKLSTKLVTRAFLVSGILPVRPVNPRTLPLAVSDHLVREQVIELAAAGRSLWLPEDVSANVGDMAFSRVVARIGHGIRITYTLDTGTRARIPAAEAEAIYTLSDKIGDETGLEFYLEKSGKEEDAAGVDEEILKPLRDDIKTMLELSKKGDDASLIAALGILNTDIAKLKSPSPEAGLLEGMRGGILAQLRRSGPALASLRSATEQFSGNPEVFRLRLAFELDKNDPAAFNTALHKTLQAQKAIVTNLDVNWVRSAQQHIIQRPEAERIALTDDLCVSLADADWNLAPRTVEGNLMLGCALSAHVRDGDVARARAMLALEPAVSTLVLAAMDQRDKALWPDLDRIGADGFRKALEREATEAATAAKAAPKDYKVAYRLVRALRQLGRAEEAAEVARPLVEDRAALETVGEDAAWLVDQYAYALQSQGKPDEAIAALDSLLSLGLDNYPWLLSQAVNRLILLNDAGRHADVLASLPALEALGSTRTSEYGRLWMQTEKACALHGLGRDAEAAPAEKQLAAAGSVNPAARTRAAACRGDVAAIAADIVARLGDENQRDGALGLFLAFQDRPSKLPVEARLIAVMKQARERPEVQAALRKVGRTVRYAGSSAGWSSF